MRCPGGDQRLGLRGLCLKVFDLQRGGAIEQRPVANTPIRRQRQYVDGEEHPGVAILSRVHGAVVVSSWDIALHALVRETWTLAGESAREFVSTFSEFQGFLKTNPRTKFLSDD